MLFEKRFDMLSQFLLSSRTQKVIFYPLVLGQQPLISLQIQKFNKAWKYILISLKTFLIYDYVYISPPKNKSKKTRTNFDLTTDSLIEKYSTISIKFEIYISQLITNILRK